MKTIIWFSLFICIRSLLEGQNGAALHFDGSNDYVSLTNKSSAFDIPSNHQKSMQCWFKNSSNQGAHVRIFSTGSANWTSGFWIGFQAGSNALMLELSDGIGFGKVITATVATRGDNKWHHATAVFNGSLAALYLDGILQGTVNIASEGIMNSSGSVHMGSSYDNESGSFFHGMVDEVRIWDRALCANEILATKDCELTGTESGLVAYYNFNQGSAAGSNPGLTTLTDHHINANHGTLYSFSLSGSTSNWQAPGGVISGNTCANSGNGTLVTSSTNPLCPGMSTTLTALHVSTATWQPGNFTGSSIVVAPSNSTTYTITSTDKIQCNSTTAFTQSVTECTSNIEETRGSGNVHIFPNPFKHTLRIELPEPSRIRIMDVHGRILKENDGIEPHVLFDLHILTPGIYFVEIVSESERRCFRVVKE